MSVGNGAEVQGRPSEICIALHVANAFHGSSNGAGEIRNTGEREKRSKEKGR